MENGRTGVLRHQLTFVPVTPLSVYRTWIRLKTRAFSVLCRGSFRRFGGRSVIVPPLRVSGERWIEVGAGVTIGADCWLQVLSVGRVGEDGALRIGDGTSIAGSCTVSVARSVDIGKRVLIAGNVYISDHRHSFDDPVVPIADQGIADIRPVKIGDGAWLGRNVVVCPGVTIGRHAVVGANSVVKHDVPDYAVAAGAPARVVRMGGHGKA